MDHLPKASAGRSELTSTFRADFDRIALLSTHEWNHNDHYHGFLLRSLPAGASEVLEIGCGTGAFSRLLSGRCGHVLALDLSPQMIRIAKERSAQFTNIDFAVADAATYELPPEHFDCIVSIATLHHLPMEEILTRMKESLKLNGVLLVLDLFQADGLLDEISNALGCAVAGVLKTGTALFNKGGLERRQKTIEAWAEHDKHDSFLRLAQIRQLSARILPGAHIRKHLLWRYSLIWKKQQIQ